VRIRERPDQDAVDDAEERGVRANPKGQRQDDGERKPGSPSQPSRRVTQVLHQRFYERETSLVSVAVFHDFHVAELQQRLTPGFDGRQAGATVLGGLHGDVFFDFGSQEVFVPRGRHPPSQPVEEPPHRFHFRSCAFTEKNRSIIAAVCSQLWVSACSCLRPCRVSR
jgi:hypothetical protein